MVESTAANYDVGFDMKKHFNPQEITGMTRWSFANLIFRVDQCFQVL